MADTYEQEIISLPSNDIITEDPIIVKGGTYPPFPSGKGIPNEDSIEIHLRNLFNLAEDWTWKEVDGKITITIKRSSSKWIIKPDSPNSPIAVTERPKSHFGNITIIGFEVASTSNPVVLKPDLTVEHQYRNISIDVVPIV